MNLTTKWFETDIDWRKINRNWHKIQTTHQLLILYSLLQRTKSSMSETGRNLSCYRYAGEQYGPASLFLLFLFQKPSHIQRKSVRVYIIFIFGKWLQNRIGYRLDAWIKWLRKESSKIRIVIMNDCESSIQVSRQHVSTHFLPMAFG